MSSLGRRPGTFIVHATRTHNYGRPSTHLEPLSSLFTYSFSTASLESMAWCLYRDAFGECIADGKTCSDPVTGVGGGPRGPYCWTGNITLFENAGDYEAGLILMLNLPLVALCLVCCGWCPMLAGDVCWARSGKCECLYYDEAETPQAGPSVPVSISNPMRVASPRTQNNEPAASLMTTTRSVRIVPVGPLPVGPCAHYSSNFCSWRSPSQSLG